MGRAGCSQFMWARSGLWKRSCEKVGLPGGCEVGGQAHGSGGESADPFLCAPAAPPPLPAPTSSHLPPGLHLKATQQLHTRTYCCYLFCPLPSARVGMCDTGHKSCLLEPKGVSARTQQLCTLLLFLLLTSLPLHDPGVSMSISQPSGSAPTYTCSPVPS